jgi:hypothetical protein
VKYSQAVVLNNYSSQQTHKHCAETVATVGFLDKVFKGVHVSIILYQLTSALALSS